MRIVFINEPHEQTMTPHSLRPFLLGTLLVTLFALPTGAAGANLSVDAQLATLKSPNPEVRVEALRALQTSLDPRIPEALLPLLADEGNSIRRLAARGVGSRWWQIPKDRRPAYLEALKRNARKEFEDETNMVERAIGLLNRDYAGNMFARSANKRWVIYERRGLPCLIDTTTETEELLGWSPEGAGWFDCAWGNTPLNRSVAWHPKKEIAAFTMLMGRKESAIWIWRHGAGVQKLESSDMVKTLGIRDSDLNGGGGLFVDVKGWTGDELRFEFSYVTIRKDVYTDHTAVLGWNATKRDFRVIARDKASR